MLELPPRHDTHLTRWGVHGCGGLINRGGVGRLCALVLDLQLQDVVGAVRRRSGLVFRQCRLSRRIADEISKQTLSARAFGTASERRTPCRGS